MTCGLSRASFVGYLFVATAIIFAASFSELFAAGTTSTDTKSSAASVSSYYAVGDSIAVQLTTIGMPGTAKGGTNPKQILAMIQGISAGTLKGKTVVLSSGASNTGSSMSNLGDPAVVKAYVPQQIQALKSAGAQGVILLGVGSRINGDMNNVLQQIAQQTGARFSALTQTGDGVHPKSAKDLLASLGSAPPGDATAQQQQQSGPANSSVVGQPTGSPTGSPSGSPTASNASAPPPPQLPPPPLPPQQQTPLQTAFADPNAYLNMNATAPTSSANSLFSALQPMSIGSAVDLTPAQATSSTSTPSFLLDMNAVKSSLSETSDDTYATSSDDTPMLLSSQFNPLNVQTFISQDLSTMPGAFSNYTFVENGSLLQNFLLQLKDFLLGLSGHF